MKEVTNVTRMQKSYDLDSYDDNGRRLSVHLKRNETVKVKDSDAKSLQLQAAEKKGEIVISEVKKTSSKSSSGSEDKESDSKKSDTKKSSKPKE